MATKLSLNELTAGAIIGDTHDVRWRYNLFLDFPHCIENFVTIDTRQGSKIITDLVRENGKPDYCYINKKLVIIGFDYINYIKAAYSFNAYSLTFYNIFYNS